MQEYLIVKGQIDPIETESPPKIAKDRPCHDSDALVAVSVLYSSIGFDNLRTLEDIVRYL